MAPRTERAECWGPYTPAELLRRLGAEDDWMRVCAARSGHHESPAAYIAWQQLSKQHQAGRPLNPAGLPFHAKRMVERVQTSAIFRDW
jgi:hypothetical protein